MYINTPDNRDHLILTLIHSKSILQSRVFSVFEVRSSRWEMGGGHGEGTTYKGITVHAPKRWHVVTGKGLCAVMWYVITRISQFHLVFSVARFTPFHEIEFWVHKIIWIASLLLVKDQNCWWISFIMTQKTDLFVLFYSLNLLLSIIRGRFIGLSLGFRKKWRHCVKLYG